VVGIEIQEEERMRLYDIVALVTPDLSDEDALKLASEYRKILSDGGAEIVKDEPWGRRRLAFPILRKREAFYQYFQVSAEPAIIAETERRMKLSDQVLRHLAVRADLELKRSTKMAVRLKEKAARRPPRPPAPMAAAPGTASAPGAAPAPTSVEKGEPS
jgi:small subunit ribosomal protein S6